MNYNPSYLEAEAGGSQIQVLFVLQSEVKASLISLVRPCLKIKKQKKGGGLGK